MYTGSFFELVNGVRSADVTIRDSGGNVVDFSGFSGSVNVANFPATQNVAGTVNVGNFPDTQNVIGVVAVTNFPATQNVAIVSGELATINIGNFPVTQNVSGVFWQANQPVTVLGGFAANTSFVPTSNLAAPHLILAANAGRKHFAISNPLNKTLAVGYANSISNTAYAVPVAAGGYYESPVGGYTGDVYALFVGSPSAGNVAVTEFA